MMADTDRATATGGESADRLYPLSFEPVFKDYVWGGRRLATLGRRLPPEGPVAESWEIAAHEDGTTRVENGPFAGRLLTELHAQLGLDLIGRNNAWAQDRGKFPLLIKLLDANAPLSVQVHPDDDYARIHEGNELGKTEMWYVLAAEPGAEIILGVTAGTTREKLARAIEESRLEPYLHRLTVRTGDHICVPAGTLHAILGGLIMVEIQQNSNTTYRFYDWGRLGAGGKPRPLHVDRALDAVDLEAVEPQVEAAQVVEERQGFRRAVLCRNNYFMVERVELEPGFVLRGTCNGDTLEIWGVIDGRVEINGVDLPAVRFALLPAALGDYQLRALSAATLLRTYTPPPRPWLDQA
jgi:mannose-6-phosphate isomerase